MRVSGRCHALLGFAYVPPWSVNAGFVRGDLRTLIVDSGPTAQAAATILGYAEAAAPGNVIVAVNTERHLDHVAGNGVLRARGLDVYGHPTVRRSDAELARDVEEYCGCVPDEDRRARGEGRIPFAGTRIANPNLEIAREQEIDLGGVSVSVLLVPGHTTANLALWVASERVLFTGDSVVSDYAPNLTSGGPDDWRLWLTALDRLHALRAEVLVPGHGRVLCGRGEIDAEIARVRACLSTAACGRPRPPSGT